MGCRSVELVEACPLEGLVRSGTLDYCLSAAPKFGPTSRPYINVMDNNTLPCRPNQPLKAELILSAPFRTRLNLNSVNALLHSEQTCDLLAAAAYKAQQTITNEIVIDPTWISNGTTELHYSQISEDSIPLSATPLFRVRPSRHLLNNLVARNNKTEAAKICNIRECFLDYYDNTIGLLYCFLGISLPNIGDNSLQVIDLWTVGFCASIIGLAFRSESLLYEALHALSPKYRRLSLVMRPGKDLVFLAPTETIERPLPPREKLLWVTRILRPADTSFTKDMLEHWTQQQDPETKTIRFDNADLAFFVGNSVIVSKFSNTACNTIKTSLSVCAYYYALYDVCNRNLRSIRLDLAKHTFRARLPVNRLNYIRSQLEFLENEQIDTVLGLQGSRKLVAARILEVWEYKALVDTVGNKLSGVGRLVDYYLQEQQSHYTRLVEAILAAIGGVSLLDFSLNLLTFAKNKGLSADNVSGIIDVAKNMPPDGLLYCTAIVLVTTFFLVVRRS